MALLYTGSVSASSVTYTNSPNAQTIATTAIPAAIFNAAYDPFILAVIADQWTGTTTRAVPGVSLMLRNVTGVGVDVSTTVNNVSTGVAGITQAAVGYGVSPIRLGAPAGGFLSDPTLNIVIAASSTPDVIAVSALAVFVVYDAVSYANPTGNDPTFADLTSGTFTSPHVNASAHSPKGALPTVDPVNYFIAAAGVSTGGGPSSPDFTGAADWTNLHGVASGLFWGGIAEYVGDYNSLTAISTSVAFGTQSFMVSNQPLLYNVASQSRGHSWGQVIG